MIRWKRAATLALLSWLAPFAVSLVLFPVKKANAPLFEIVMALAVLVTAVFLLDRYFDAKAISMREAVMVSLLWMATNLVFDFAMFSQGPMKMAPLAYYSEIGLGYLIFPLFAFGAARVAGR